jgi:hypothetical protein
MYEGNTLSNFVRTTTQLGGILLCSNVILDTQSVVTPRSFQNTCLQDYNLGSSTNTVEFKDTLYYRYISR